MVVMPASLNSTGRRDCSVWFEVQPQIEKINLILAVLCERTVDTGHCLRHSNKYYRMIDSRGNQVHYRKGTKVMFIQAFDGSQYCCVNDKDIYALEEIPEHETKSKDLDIDYTPPKPKNQVDFFNFGLHFEHRLDTMKGKGKLLIEFLYVGV